VTISTDGQRLTNLHELSCKFLRCFREHFLDKVVESLEQELPASENRVEPLYLEVIFRLQLVYQRFQSHLEASFPHLQSDKQLLNGLEGLKITMVEDISSKLQAFNERILDNMSKQV